MRITFFPSYKLVLTHKKYGTKHTYYKSDTTEIDYDENIFTAEWKDKVQTLPRGSNNNNNRLQI